MTYVCTEKATMSEGLKEIEDLKKEIKNLKLIQETNEKQIQNDIKDREELRNNLMLTENDRDERKLKATDLWEENKKLKNELAKQIDGGNGLRDKIEYWKRKCKELKKQIDKLRTDNIYEEGLYD